MSNARRSEAECTFNGHNVTAQLKPYLTSITYTDVASGSSDQLDLALQDRNLEWLRPSWYPRNGDKVRCRLLFHDWTKDGDEQAIDSGIFTLDETSFSGGPAQLKLGCVSVPNDESFRVRTRTKTWENISLEGIGTEIAARYGLSIRYSGDYILIQSLEQSDQTDCEFLYKVCETYGQAMKVYSGSIVIYSQTLLENAAPVAALNRKSFEDDTWTYTDTITGIYTGARISYKSSDSDDEINIYVGFMDENAPGSRVLKVTETANNLNDAYLKAAASVNQSNQEATTFSGRIFPNPAICAGICVTITGMGAADGKYFVDQSKIEIGDSGTTQNIEMHKCQQRLTVAQAAPAQSETQPAASGNYQIGDIVNFHGGMHYVSSDPGAKGYSAKAGPAKITLGPDCAGNGQAHPWHLVHTDNTSNVYGWVDEGTFD